MRTTTAIYRHEDRLSDAVRELLRTSVPADSIRVTLQDASGSTLREVPVQAEPGVLRGIAVGAGIGAALGALGFALIVAGVLPPGTEILAADPVRWALRLVFGGAAAAAPLGGLLGMGRWRVRPDLTHEDAERAATMLVAVRSDALADTAREVFERTGAEAVGQEEPAEGDQRVRS